MLSQLFQREIRSKDDLRPEELDRAVVACVPDDDRGDDDSSGIPDDRDREDRDDPPPELLDCITRILGRFPDGPVSDADKQRVQAACSPGGDDRERPDDRGRRPGQRSC